MAEQQQDEVEVKGPGGLAMKIRGTDVTSILQFAGIVMMCYILWTHTTDTKDMNKEFVTVLQNQTKAQGQMIVVQKEQNCLLSLDQTRRESEYNNPNGFCKRMARNDYP